MTDKILIDRAELQKVLEALVSVNTSGWWESQQSYDKKEKAITALRQTLATAEESSGVEQQPADEPVASAWIHNGEMVNAFPWPPGDPRSTDNDRYWIDKGYKAEPLYTRAKPAAREPLTDLKLMMEHSAFQGRLELSDALANIDEFYTRTEQKDPSGLGCKGPLCGFPEHGGDHHPLCKHAAAPQQKGGAA